MGTTRSFRQHPELFGELVSTGRPDRYHQQRRRSPDAIRLIKQRLSTIPNVLSSPAPEVDILQFTPAGPLLCVRPFCSNQHYGQVVFDTNRLIREAFDEAGYPSPMPAYAGQRDVRRAADRCFRALVSVVGGWWWG